MIIFPVEFLQNDRSTVSEGTAVFRWRADNSAVTVMVAPGVSGGEDDVLREGPL